MSKFSDAVDSFKQGEFSFSKYYINGHFCITTSHSDSATNLLNGLSELYDDVQSLKADQQKTYSELQFAKNVADNQQKTTVTNQQKTFSEVESLKAHYS